MEGAYFLYAGTGTSTLTVIFCQNSDFMIVFWGRRQTADGKRQTADKNTSQQVIA